MQRYGLIVADIGSPMFLSGAPASVDANNNITQTWDLTDIFAANGLEALNVGDFEVVNLRPIVTGLSANSGAAGSPLTVNGQNFSGAAGHLSVFFGNTAASALTVLSDNQISVNVPSGSGTVDVTVQSGLNEVDNLSSNPNANVNAPIFGYGTSAVTVADKFTYVASAPVVVTSVSSTMANGTYGLGASINITVTFSKAVNVTGTSAIGAELRRDRRLHFGFGLEHAVLLLHRVSWTEQRVAGCDLHCRVDAERGNDSGFRPHGGQSDVAGARRGGFAQCEQEYRDRYDGADGCELFG